MAEGNHEIDNSNREVQNENAESNLSKEWAIARIVDSKIEKSAAGIFETKFLVEWVETKEQNWENTWVPFENVSHLPLLMKKFRSASKTKIIESFSITPSQETLNTLSPFPVPPKEILSAFKLPEETIPKGNETILNIVGERGEGNKKLWDVIFKEYDFITFVRKPLMVYLFPVQSCYFMMELKRKFSKLAESIVKG